MHFMCQEQAFYSKWFHIHFHDTPRLPPLAAVKCICVENFMEQWMEAENHEHGVFTKIYKTGWKHMNMRLTFLDSVNLI